MGLVLPVEEVAAQAADLEVLNSCSHLRAAYVAAISPLPHLVKVGTQLGFIKILQASNEHILSLQLVLSIAAVLLCGPALD